MSNMTLRILTIKDGDQKFFNLNEVQLREKVSELDNEKWIFVDGRMVKSNEFANVNLADDATVYVTPAIVAGSA